MGWKPDYLEGVIIKTSDGGSTWTEQDAGTYNAIDRVDALTRALSRKRPGEKVKLTLFRNGRKTDLTVTLGEASQNL